MPGHFSHNVTVSIQNIKIYFNSIIFRFLVWHIVKALWVIICCSLAKWFSVENINVKALWVIFCCSLAKWFSVENIKFQILPVGGHLNTIVPLCPLPRQDGRGVCLARQFWGNLHTCLHHQLTLACLYVKLVAPCAISHTINHAFIRSVAGVSPTLSGTPVLYSNCVWLCINPKYAGPIGSSKVILHYWVGGLGAVCS